MYVCMRVYMYDVCMYVRTYVRMYICMYIWVCMYVYKHTYVSMLECIALVLDKMGSEWLETNQKTLILNFLIF